MGGDVHVDNPSEAEAEAIRTLLARGFIIENTYIKDKCLDHRIVAYSISDQGRVALSDHESALEYQREQYAENQAQKEREWLQAETIATKNRWFSLYSAIIGALIGSVFTLLCEHAAEITAFIRGILGLP